MHECPECGQACDCCGDDTWDNSEAACCEHECDDEYDEDEYDGFDADDSWCPK